MTSKLYMGKIISLLPRLDNLDKPSVWPSPTWEQTHMWGNLESIWSNLDSDPLPGQLNELAVQAFFIVSILSKKDSARTMADALMLHADKNAGYAGQNADPWINFRGARKFGVTDFKGVLVRMSDKYARIVSLRANPANDRISESLLDTLRDLAAYALIATCILEGDGLEPYE